VSRQFLFNCTNPPCPPADYGALRYVDSIESNFLFRGPEPANVDSSGKKWFDYCGLTDAIRRAALPPSVQLPQSFFNDPPGYFLVVINLLHPDETDKIAAEIDFCQTYPDQARIHLWDTDGTPECYFHTAPNERAHRVRTLGEWLPDPLIWRVAQLRRMLEPSQSPVPVVVYVHCDGGCDRTAELIGAYRLRFMHSAWSTVMNDQPCNRPLGCDNYRALQWYAYWLNDTHGFSLTGIGQDCGCYDPGGAHKPCSPAAT
jgi:hypothetical protein